MKYPYVKRLPRFEYLAPKTINEAIGLLSRHGKEAKPIAGGTDILLKMKRREEVPQYVIGLKNIPGLTGNSLMTAKVAGIMPCNTLPLKFIRYFISIRGKL